MVMFLGLGSRKFKYIIPEFLNIYLGDALWALMIFIICGFIFKNMELKKVAKVSLLFCYIIEITQLYHAPWIDNIRLTTLGALILGNVFTWNDLVAYTLGIGVGIIFEYIIFNFQKKKYVF